MTDKQNTITAVPTNIITGFLGVGKTTAILQLLKAKPAAERWAILVNEFGEVGVDGSMVAGNYAEDTGVYIREVPGGCMCCAAGLPMQIALNQLLVRSKPDRLLIEPTGLGHPLEVLETLSSDTYKQVLSLQKTLTLVDARKLSDPRYTQHETFRQQIAIADIIVGNKLDLYQDKDKQALVDYARANNKLDVRIQYTEHGNLDPSLLEGRSAFISKVSNVSEESKESKESSHDHHDHREKVLLAEEAIPDNGYVRANNMGEGFLSVGWRFSADKIFDRRKLFSLLSGLNVERMKAVFITKDGIFAYNLTSDALTEMELDECFESRIEIIYLELNSKFEFQLMECVAP